MKFQNRILLLDIEETSNQHTKRRIQQMIEKNGGRTRTDFTTKQEITMVISDHNLTEEIERIRKSSEKRKSKNGQKLYRSVPMILREALDRNIPIRSVRQFMREMNNQEPIKRSAGQAQQSSYQDKPVPPAPRKKLPKDINLGKNFVKFQHKSGRYRPEGSDLGDSSDRMLSFFIEDHKGDNNNRHNKSRNGISDVMVMNSRAASSGRQGSERECGDENYCYHCEMAVGDMVQHMETRVHKKTIRDYGFWHKTDLALQGLELDKFLEKELEQDNASRANTGTDENDMWSINSIESEDFENIFDEEEDEDSGSEVHSDSGSLQYDESSPVIPVTERKVDRLPNPFNLLVNHRVRRMKKIQELKFLKETMKRKIYTDLHCHLVESRRHPKILLKKYRTLRKSFTKWSRSKHLHLSNAESEQRVVLLICDMKNHEKKVNSIVDEWNAILKNISST